MLLKNQGRGLKGKGAALKRRYVRRDVLTSFVKKKRLTDGGKEDPKWTGPEIFVVRLGRALRVRRSKLHPTGHGCRRVRCQTRPSVPLGSAFCRAPFGNLSILLSISA